MLEDRSVESDFMELFDGRHDAYGSEDGGCVRAAVLPFDYAIMDHLQSDKPIGVYPQRDDLTVKWGCVDFDDADAETHALKLEQALDALGLTGWREKSRSKGWHVWVFCDAWVPSVIMRNALLVACAVADVPTKEVNPKQVKLDGKGFGNYVRLPYPKLAEDSDRRKVWGGDADGVGMPWPFEAFVLNAMNNRATPKDLETVAALWTEPVKPITSGWTVGPVEGDRGPLWTGITGCGDGYTIWRDGPLPGSDRSGTLYKLAAILRTHEIPPSRAMAIVTDADVRWGKFHTRPDGEKRLMDLVQKAYEA